MEFLMLLPDLFQLQCKYILLIPFGVEIIMSSSTEELHRKQKSIDFASARPLLIIRVRRSCFLDSCSGPYCPMFHCRDLPPSGPLPNLCFFSCSPSGHGILNPCRTCANCFGNATQQVPPLWLTGSRWPTTKKMKQYVMAHEFPPPHTN